MLPDRHALCAGFLVRTKAASNCPSSPSICVAVTHQIKTQLLCQKFAEPPPASSVDERPCSRPAGCGERTAHHVRQLTSNCGSATVYRVPLRGQFDSPDRVTTPPPTSPLPTPRCPIRRIKLVPVCGLAPHYLLPGTHGGDQPVLDREVCRTSPS